MTTEKIRCGAHYCEICKKCTNPARLRKNFTPDWWHICEECEPDVLEVTFRPRPESLMTNFKIKYQDVKLLIKHLQEFKITKDNK